MKQTLGGFMHMHPAVFAVGLLVAFVFFCLGAAAACVYAYQRFAA